MYVNPAFGYDGGRGGRGMQNESSTDPDHAPHAWASAPVGAPGRNSRATADKSALLPQQGRGRRAWLRDGGVVAALLLAVLAVGLAARQQAGGCDCAGAEAASGLRARMGTLCDSLYQSKAISASLDVAQVMPTIGATGWEAFTMNGEAYLAVANRKSGRNFNTISRIYRRSQVSGLFEEVQQVPTEGAHDWEAFTLGGATYLALANSRNDTTHSVTSRIYRHSSTSGFFEVVQEVPTTGAVDWEAFTLDGTACLAVANWFDGDIHNLLSRIYRHSKATGRFELMQEVPTNGAHAWESFTLGGATYLAVANWFNDTSYDIMSHIYRYSARDDKFVLVQEVPTSGAADWQAFRLGGATYLAVANSLNDTTGRATLSRIYRHSEATGQFEMVQEVATTGAADWEDFTLGGATYLAVANWFDGENHTVTSRVYRHSATSGLFEEVAAVGTSGAYSWRAFSVAGVVHLAVANWIGASSDIYSVAAPC